MNLNFFVVLLLFVLLAHNIILINEESLILICFVATISIIISKFGYLTDFMFKKYEIRHKNELSNSLDHLIQILREATMQKYSKNFLVDSIYLKQYWNQLVKNFVYWFLIDFVYKIRLSYNSYLSALQTNENKIIKLLNTAFIKNLYDKVLLKNFAEKQLRVRRFKTQNIILVREWARFERDNKTLF